jgi:hypothetical protein
MKAGIASYSFGMNTPRYLPGQNPSLMEKYATSDWPYCLTLRDLFAGLVAASVAGQKQDLAPDAVAQFAYLQADELLKVRNQKPED